MRYNIEESVLTINSTAPISC